MILILQQSGVKKVAIIEKGSIVEKGNILDIFQSPKSDIGKKLVNASKIVLEPNY